MATLKKIGVGVVGLGVGEQHARAYADHAGCELLWLSDLSAERAQGVRRRLGRGRVADDLSKVLEDPAVDVVSVASFDHHHAEAVLAALAAEKHVFVEKPLCQTAEELAAVASAWSRHGRPHLRSNLVLRAAPLYRWLKDAIDAGRLGRLYAFDGDYLYGRLEKITEGWRGTVPNYSVIEGGGIHLIDLLLWLTGERPARAATVGNRIATMGTGFRYADFQATTFLFPSGLVGRITANFGCVHRHHHLVRVFGTEATFIYDDAGPRLHSTRDEDARAEPVDKAPLPAGKGVLIPPFVDAIIGGADPGPAARREFDLISATAAAARAFTTGRTEEIHYL